MREGNTFGCPFGAGGEKDHCLGIGISPASREVVGQSRQQQADEPDRLVEGRQMLAYVLEIDDAHVRFFERVDHVAELGELDEAS